MDTEEPTTEAELLARADSLAGIRLAELAARFERAVPADLRRAKGWVGTLLERSLGATAASRDEPDFRRIAVELKTIPVDSRGNPRESTFVCTIALEDVGDTEWERSRVRRKLRRVLWVPIEAGPRLGIGERRVGAPLLWSPSAEQEAALRFDWEELAGLIGRGDVESVTAHLGRFLQVRPKGASSRARRGGIDRDGRVVAVPPRGFYLRTSFTRAVLRGNYALSG